MIESVRSQETEALDRRKVRASAKASLRCKPIGLKKYPETLALSTLPVAETAKPSIQMLGFQRIATFIKGDGGRIAYEVSADDPAQALWRSAAPATYMWVVAGKEHPVYIGKATKGMEKRAREHRGGFHETATEREKRKGQSKPPEPRAGLGHAGRIRALWKARKKLELWVRPAGRLSLFQFEGSLASVEEEILIQLFRPRWNSEVLKEEALKKVPDAGMPIAPV